MQHDGAGPRAQDEAKRQDQHIEDGRVLQPLGIGNQERQIGGADQREVTVEGVARDQAPGADDEGGRPSGLRRPFHHLFA